MSNPVRCPECRGRKEVIGNGMMIQPCKRCNQVGWVNEAPKVAAEEPAVTFAKSIGTRIDKQMENAIKELGDDAEYIHALNVPRETNLNATQIKCAQTEQEADLTSFPAKLITKPKGRPKKGIRR